MRIMFVQPKAGFLMRGTTYPVCRSILVTASYMKSLGHEVMIFDKCIDFRKSKKVIDSFNPEMVMVYVPPTASLEDSAEISELSRKKGAVTVWAEVVASALAEQVVENGLTDFVITGETESKLEALIKELSGERNFGSIPGLTYLDDKKAITTDNENNSDLENLPSIDWDLVNVKKCFREFPHCKRMLYMYTSRGCPNKCAFCYNTMFYNSQHRKRPLRYFLDEVKYLEEKYKLDGVNFSDEVLMLTEDEINQIANFRKKNNLNFTLPLQSFDCLFTNLLYVLKNAFLYMSVSITYSAFILWGSSMFALKNIIYINNLEIYYNLPITYTVVLIMFLLILYSIIVKFRSLKKIESLIYDCFIELHGRNISIRGFLDTGNSLCDIITGLPVIIIGKSVAENIIPDIEKFLALQSVSEKYKIIPYKTADGHRSILPAFKPDKVFLNDNEIEVIVAVTNENLGIKQGFNCLLNRYCIK